MSRMSSFDRSRGWSLRGALPRVAALVVLAFACLAPAALAQDASPSATPSSAASSSGPASAAPSAGGAALDLCWDASGGLGQAPCELPAGRYQPTLFIPPMAFDLDEGWLNARNYEDGWDLVIADQPSDLSVIRGATGGYADPTPEDPSDTPALLAIDPGMAGVVDYLTTHPELKVVAGPTETTVGGLPATQLDLDALADAPGLFLVSQDAYNAVAGDRLRVWVIDHPAAAITIIAETYAREAGGTADPADYEPFQARIQTIVDSVTFPDSAEQ